MAEISDLQPGEVYQYFEKISRIPRGSGHMEAISDYLVNFAIAHNLKYRKDAACNVIIWKDASKGHEQARPLILQGHMDMVDVKEADCGKDLLTEGIDLRTDGTWVWGEGTSLGGDDGIAVAYMLAVLASETIEHPALTAVFTVNEEIGMLGAAALDMTDVNGNTMLNMDSEEEGVFLTGCAGGATVSCHFPAEEESVEATVYRLKIGGLHGGHSGQEIDKGYLNANVLLGRYLLDAPEELQIHFNHLQGGEKDNAIAAFCTALIAVPFAQSEELEKYTEELEKTVKKEYERMEPDLFIRLEKQSVKNIPMIKTRDAAGIANALIHMPDGVQRMMPGMEHMVETSLNMGILNMQNNEWELPEAVLTYSVRSSSDTQKENLIRKIKHLTAENGGYCRVSGEYPAWEYRKQSPLREKMVDVYQKMYGKKPRLEVIHAGVECGIFASKLPDLDCVSIGPDMRDIHTAKEHLSVASVERTWKYILEVLKEWN